MPAVLHGLLVGLQCCMLTALDFNQTDFKRTEWDANRAIDQKGRQTDAVVIVVMSILGLHRFISRWLDILWKTAATAFEVICRWSVTGAVFYDAIITACRHRSVCQRLVANLTQLDQLTWCTSRHLTWRLRDDTEGMLIISVSELLKIAVWIIENEKNYSISAKKSCMNY